MVRVGVCQYFAASEVTVKLSAPKKKREKGRISGCLFVVCECGVKQGEARKLMETSHLFPALPPSSSAFALRTMKRKRHQREISVSTTKMMELQISLMGAESSQ
jgi:hypothetical protein